MLLHVCQQLLEMTNQIYVIIELWSMATQNCSEDQKYLSGYTFDAPVFIT